jgi:hypothetical protein
MGSATTATRTAIGPANAQRNGVDLRIAADAMTTPASRIVLATIEMTEGAWTTVREVMIEGETTTHRRLRRVRIRATVMIPTMTIGVVEPRTRLEMVSTARDRTLARIPTRRVAVNILLDITLVMLRAMIRGTAVTPRLVMPTPATPTKVRAAATRMLALRMGTVGSTAVNTVGTTQERHTPLALTLILVPVTRLVVPAKVLRRLVTIASWISVITIGSVVCAVCFCLFLVLVFFLVLTSHSFF